MIYYSLLAMMIISPTNIPIYKDVTSLPRNVTFSMMRKIYSHNIVSFIRNNELFHRLFSRDILKIIVADML